MTNDKYFFISASGVKNFDIGMMTDDDESDIDKLLNEASGAKRPSGKLPVTINRSLVITAKNGLFVPAAIESKLKLLYGLDDCVITFIREMTQEEFDLNQKVIADQSKPVPLGGSVVAELEDLLNRASSGDLSVTSDLRPDFARTDEEKFLLENGFPMDLMNPEGLWDNDKGDDDANL
jgi:hypothetical protein